MISKKSWPYRLIGSVSKTDLSILGAGGFGTGVIFPVSSVSSSIGGANIRITSHIESPTPKTITSIISAAIPNKINIKYNRL